MSSWGVSRRSLFHQGSLLAAAQALGGGCSGPRPPRRCNSATSTVPSALRAGDQRRGTFTIITGSTTLPEVKKAMDEASRGSSIWTS